MDVSPKTLREVEFREKMRGYHPEDVDQFLERVAAAWEVLQDRLRQAIERAQRAEQAATEAGGNDDALRRTLLLAQRTADLAVQEGREQAAHLVSTAEQQSQSLLSEAEQRVHSLVTDADRRAQSLLQDSERRAQSMLGEAEQRARRGHEDTLMEVRAELATLEVTRQRLQMDVDTMTRWVSEHRNQLRAALEDALTRIEQIDVSPPPAAGSPYPLEGSTGVSRDSQAAPGASFGGTDPMASWVSPAAAAPAPWSPPSGAVAAPTAASWSPPAAAVATPTSAAWTPPPAPLQPAPAPLQPAPAPGPPTTWPREETAAWRPPESEAGGDDGGDADPYFAELRRAISDNDPLGPAPADDPQSANGGSGAPGYEA
jgi:DivIVA domain-containing protein